MSEAQSEGLLQVNYCLARWLALSNMHIFVTCRNLHFSEAETEAQQLMIEGCSSPAHSKVLYNRRI